MAYEGSQRLGDLFKSRREKGEPGLPTLSVTLNNGLVDRATLGRKTDTSLTEDEHLLVRKGDIVYNMMRMWQGASGLADKDGLVSPAYVVLAPKAKIDSRYASYLFKSQRMIYLFWAYSYGLTEDRLRLYHRDFTRIPVTVPPVKKQFLIAEILATWGRAIEITEKLIQNKTKQRVALAQELLAPCVIASALSEEGPFTRLGEHCVFKGGHAFNEDFQGSTEGDLPFIKVSDLGLPCNKKYISRSNNWLTTEMCGQLAVKPFPVGAVVFAKVGATLLLNRRRILTRETCIDNNMMVAIAKPGLNSDFLYHLLVSIDFAKHVQEGALPSVNQGTLSKIAMRLPSASQQEAIAARLSLAEDELFNVEKQRDLLIAERRALMQRLLTGKRRVKLDSAA